MAKEETAQVTQNFEKRLNTLIRDFVNLYKKLGADFTNYKIVVGREMELLNFIITKKTDEVELQIEKNSEY